MATKSELDAAGKRERDEDRAKSSANAAKTADQPKWDTNSIYMKELAKEGIKRQQEHMKDEADYQMTKQYNEKPARRKFARKR
jgi:hypothetical protein